MKQKISSFISRIWRPFMQTSDAGGNDPPASPTSPSAAHLVVLFLLLLVGAFVSFRWINTAKISSSLQTIISSNPAASRGRTSHPPLTCPTAALSCPSPPPSTPVVPPRTPAVEVPSLCPDYFRWIHEDLRPWARTGITREMVEQAKEMANFRLVVLGGRAYVESYGRRRTFQTRHLFTQWGILQLLRRYPGRVPDLELMFDCGDYPAVWKAANNQENATALFGYCRDDAGLDIVFPDWTFWGWPEINMKPWEPLLEDLKAGNRRVKWVDRAPFAYWKGNPWVAPWRQDLLKCNVPGGQDWNARLYVHDWGHEIKHGFKNSDLASQCKHRYKIYIEGATWSVSEKYILACDSPTLLVKPRYFNFFSRGLVPLRHYWPVRKDVMCKSIKFAVDWGNNHQQKAQEIGKKGSGFVREELKMDNIYDYMFHLLNEYAKLLKFKPTKPRNAIELCPETLACPANSLEKDFMVQSMVTAPREGGPCTLPPPFSPAEMRLLMHDKANSTRQVELWEDQKTKV